MVFDDIDLQNDITASSDIHVSKGPFPHSSLNPSNASSSNSSAIRPGTLCCGLGKPPLDLPSLHVELRDFSCGAAQIPLPPPCLCKSVSCSSFLLRLHNATYDSKH